MQRVGIAITALHRVPVFASVAVRRRPLRACRWSRRTPATLPCSSSTRSSKKIARISRASELEPIMLQDGTARRDCSALSPAARDAFTFTIFEDCSGTTNVRSSSTRRSSSVLPEYHQLFLKGACLVKYSYPSPGPHMTMRSIPLTLRGTRVVFLFLKQFFAELATEGEVFLPLLIKLVSGETEAGESRPSWIRGDRDGWSWVASLSFSLSRL
jgi:hypothetical protein